MVCPRSARFVLGGRRGIGQLDAGRLQLGAQHVERGRVLGRAALVVALVIGAQLRQDLLVLPRLPVDLLRVGGAQPLALGVGAGAQLLQLLVALGEVELCRSRSSPNRARSASRATWPARAAAAAVARSWRSVVAWAVIASVRSSAR